MHSQGQFISYARVPTAAERQGNYSALLQRFAGNPNYVLYDPYSTVLAANGSSSRTPYPNNVISAAEINANAQATLAAFPMPNGYQDPTNPGNLNNYQYGTHTGNNNYRLDTRFDYRLSTNDSVYVSYSRSHGRDNNSGGVFPNLVTGVNDRSGLL